MKRPEIDIELPVGVVVGKGDPRRDTFTPPGPWRCVYMPNEGWGVGPQAPVRIVALVFGGQEGGERYARLIAAAPEMCEALIRLASDNPHVEGCFETGRWVKDYCPCIRKIARAALAKARGEA